MGNPTLVDTLTDLRFVSLSDCVHFHEPTASTDPKTRQTDRKAPELVVLRAWMFSQPRHMVKYIRGHQTLYPTAKMLLLQNRMSNMIWQSDRSQMLDLQVAVKAVERSLAALSPPSKPIILIHAFSNGGAHLAIQLAQAYHETVGQPLPVSACVFDSCPGTLRYGQNTSAVLHGIARGTVTRAIYSVLAFGVAFTCIAAHQLGISELVNSKLYRMLNDSQGPFLVSSVAGPDAEVRPIPRSYIFSQQDEMIAYEDVANHASEASAMLIAHHSAQPESVVKWIRCEEFDGSSHVNHLRLDGDRYWNIVAETLSKAY